jgi:hypothetical protein
LRFTQDEWASHSAPRPDLIWNYLGNLGLDLDRQAGARQAANFHAGERLETEPLAAPQAGTSVASFTDALAGCVAITYISVGDRP